MSKETREIERNYAELRAIRNPIRKDREEKRDYLVYEYKQLMDKEDKTSIEKARLYLFSKLI